MDIYKPGIGIAAGSYMLKWNALDQYVRNNQLQFMPNDNVNIFINFECIIKNLSLNREIISLVTYHKQNVVIELESAILNLAAQYKGYFRKEKCNPKIYFYYTDLKSTDPQQMKIYNKFYRSYYKNEYLKNPTFKMMGELLTDIIIPEVELIISYIPDCYFIKSKTFDGSIIPTIVSLLPDYQSYKNVIVSGDVFDTLYMFNPNFMVIYIKRRFKYFNVETTIPGVIQSIVKNESPFDLNIFGSEMYFRLLLSIKGSKIRNIRSAKGFGYGRFMKILADGIKNDVVLKDFESLGSIINLFPEKYQDDITNAFKCMSIDTQYQLINNVDAEYIKSQIVDKIDITSVEALNNKRFLDFPINLSMLV